MTATASSPAAPRKPSRISTLVSAAALAISALMTAQAHAAPSITATPSALSWNAGESLGVQVDVSGLPSGTALAAYSIALKFDSSTLTYSSTAFGTGLDVLGLGSLAFADATGSFVSVFQASLDASSDLLALQPSAFELFTVFFQASASASSAFDLYVLSVSDQNGFAIDLAPAQAVDESGTLALGLAALCALASSRRLQSAHRSNR